ncbi:MAG: hypothetical protein JXQ89_19700 [Pelagimonas sp.]
MQLTRITQDPETTAIGAAPTSVDVRAISPEQIDEIVDQFLADGQNLSIDLITLSRFGARFGQHLARSSGIPYASKPNLDLIELATEYRDKAKRDYAPVASWDSFMRFLNKLT